MPLPTAPGARNPEEPNSAGNSDNELYGRTADEQEWNEDGPLDLSSLPEIPTPQRSNGEVVDSSTGENSLIRKSSTYLSVGQLTAEQLINAETDQFAHLQEKITQVTTWVQDTLTKTNQTDNIIAARREGGDKYDEMARLLDRLILEYINSERNMPRGEDRKVLVAAVINEVLGLGPLEPLWRNSDITEIMANGPHDVQVEIKGKIIKVPGAKFRDQDHLLGLCQQILGAIGRRVDVSSPIADGRLPDLSRVSVVHNAVAPAGPNLTIRRHRDEAWTVKELVDRKSFTSDMAVDLAFWINSGCSSIIVGGTGAGKTTVLNALSGLMPMDARLITIEDNLELQLHPDRLFAAPMEARPSSSSGQGAITIRDLVRASLRMRPDRIIVGEVRDAAAFDMLQAMNTGHAGSMTTIHANGADEAIPRLESLVAQAGELEPRGVLALIAGSVDLFIIVERFPEDGSRRISGVYEVPSRIESDGGGGYALDPIPLWEFVHDSTDPVTSEVIGHYEKKNDPSPVLVRKHRLNRRKHFTIEQVYEMSKVALPE